MAVRVAVAVFVGIELILGKELSDTIALIDGCALILAIALSVAKELTVATAVTDGSALSVDSELNVGLLVALSLDEIVGNGLEVASDVEETVIDELTEPVIVAVPDAEILIDTEEETDDELLPLSLDVIVGFEDAVVSGVYEVVALRERLAVELVVPVTDGE